MNVKAWIHTPLCALMAALILCIPMLTGCDAPIREPRLTEISARLDSRDLSPEEALEIRASLDSLPSDSLNEAEQNLRAFLTIKADDKGFVEHTTDTLYLKVREYFRRHHRKLYPEVLYYGGRLYSDMGDYPEALRHYADALEKTGKGSGQMKFRATVLSQTAYLLNALRLYEPALEHLEEAIQLDSILNDTLNMVYDLQLGASIANRQEDYSKARKYVSRAMPWGIRLDSTVYAELRMNLARAAHKTGKPEEARRLIYGVPDQVSHLVWNEAAPIAAEIYLEAGVLDSAFVLAKGMTENADPLNKHIAYHFLLSEKLRPMLHQDSISTYNDRYYMAVDTRLDQNVNQAALMQHSLYNYTLHEKKRHEAERKQRILLYCIFGLVTLGTLTGSILLIVRYRKQKEITELMQKLNDMRQAKERFQTAILEKEREGVTSDEAVGSKESRQDMLERFNREMEEISKGHASERQDAVEESILQSEAYTLLQKLIMDRKGLKDTDALWKSLEQEVSKAAPGFLDNLGILAGGSLTVTDRRTALLIKCGVRPSQMASLLNITPSSVGSRRTALATKIFGRKINTRIIDEMIRRI